MNLLVGCSCRKSVHALLEGQLVKPSSTIVEPLHLLLDISCTKGLAQSSQDDVTLCLGCQRIESVDEFVSGNVSFESHIAAFEQGVHLSRSHVLNLLVVQCLPELLFVHNPFLKVV